MCDTINQRIQNWILLEKRSKLKTKKWAVFILPPESSSFNHIVSLLTKNKSGLASDFYTIIILQQHFQCYLYYRYFFDFGLTNLRDNI